jgi:hypothetical protein
MKNARKALVLLAWLEICHNRLVLLAKDQMQTRWVMLPTDKTTLIIRTVI